MINHKITHKTILTTILYSILSAIFIINPASAISDAVLEYNAINHVYFYDANGNTSCIIGAGSYDGVASAGLTPTQAGFVDTYHEIAQQLSVEYGIPWETVMAQGILESAAGTSPFATERNNFFGIGAFDSNPNNAYRYDSPMEGWRGYYENIRKTSTYRNHGVFTGDNITNPYAYAQTIKDSGYATDPNYVAKLSVLIAAIENRATEQSWPSSAELAEKYPEMLTNAAANAAGGGGGNAPTSDVSYVSGMCISQSGFDGASWSGAGSGDINQTALALSWETYRSHSAANGHLHEPNPAYQEALTSLGFSNYTEDACVHSGASCDVFVSVVMRLSGVDPNYPKTGLAGPNGQLAYLRNHPDYVYMGLADASLDIQPGDIRIRIRDETGKSSHTELITQTPNGKFKIAAASHCDRNADQQDYYPDSSYHVFRHK